MFSTSEHFSRAARALFDVQAALYTSMVQALMDDGVNAAEHQADAIRTALATSTVVSRQWLAAGRAWAPAAPSDSGPAGRRPHE